MQVFNTTLRLIARSPAYLLTYIGLLGAIGLIMVGTTFSNSNAATFEQERPTVAVINRDGGELAAGLTSFLAEHALLVELQDSTPALQDATATGLASALIIVPAGFEERFVQAAHAGSEPPQLESVVNYAQAEGTQAELLVSNYLSALHGALASEPNASLTTALATAAKVSTLTIEVDVVSAVEGASGYSGWIFYFQWISYPLTAGLIVLAGVICGVFQAGELRRRNLASPLSTVRRNMQVALGCVCLALLTWMFLCLLALTPPVGGLELLAVNPALFGLLALAALVYAFVPLSLGFLLSQFGMSEMGCNGAANIISMVFYFIGGVFTSSSFLSPEVQAVAHFTPTYWYTTAVHSLGTHGLDAPTLASYCGNLAIVALFAVAFFTVALLVGRARAQTAQASGNPAADAA